MEITTVGLDVAKRVFQVHGVDAHGKVVVRKQLRRKEVVAYFTQLPACEIGMEAGSSSHYWARRLQGLGHRVKLMAPQFVRPYVKTNKNDARDAEAICEAVTRPSMRFVPIKTAEQQAILALHRARQGFVKARTAQANQLRSLLAEFGIVLPQGIHVLLRQVPAIVSNDENGLLESVRDLFTRLLGHVKELDRQVSELEQQILQWHKSNEQSRKLEKVPGIGPITASALVATIGDARAFRHGRQLAAWLGLVPRQHSSGGKPRLHGISKRGDIYLRTLLIHGARSVLRVAARHADLTTTWLKRVQARRNANIAAVALANKHARVVWALLAHDRDYTPDYAVTSS
jgi:transposase